MPVRPIALVVGDANLAAALASRLKDLTRREVTVLPGLDHLPRAALVVTTTTRCSPAECAGVASEGRQVIVLAAVPSHFQQETYELAGASAYLPMSLDLGPLARTIECLLHEGHPSPGGMGRPDTEQ